MDKNTYFLGFAAILVTAAVGLFAYKQNWLTGGLIAIAVLIGLIPAIDRIIEYFNSNQAPPPLVRQDEQSPAPAATATPIPTPIAPPPEQAPATSIPPTDPPREFLGPKITPKYLMDLYDSVDMSVQAHRLTEPYIGKWMTFTGIVENIIISDDDTSPAVSFLEMEPAEPFKIPRYHTVLMFFEMNWRGKLETLARGEEIGVRGRLSSIVGHQIVFRNCELVEANAP